MHLRVLSPGKYLRNLTSLTRLKHLKNIFHSYNSKRELKRFAKKMSREVEGLSIDDVVNRIFNDYETYFWIKQIEEEILGLCKIIERGKPASMLEIGTAQGGSLFLFSRVTKDNAEIISIDLPDGKFGGGYPTHRMQFYRDFVKKDQQLTLLRMDSHDNQTFEKVKACLAGNKLDFLFIDGDHTYEGVKKDLEMYRPLLSDDGLIALHDIARHKPDSKCRVHEYWEEIKDHYFASREIIQSDDQLWAGIGVLYISEKSKMRYG